MKIKARNTAKIKGLSVGFGEKCVLENVSLSVETGKKTFLIGDNGSGKTTLLTELLKQNESTFITSDARVGYFSQEQSQLDGSKSVLENVADGAVYPQHICRAVSHDRKLVENLADIIYELKDGKLVVYSPLSR